ncbi:MULTISPECIES: type II toxin-antitoxin system VapC family toxin [unclassified Kitasatospora]|uniref:type II toxin-antitoxin system VapC family toxin n=1 Tax=unclassified Kitasatospora TaxID=2633591 RepID=UPI00070A6292|nr:MULTISPECIES: type II toxin-antitoxin system VapC family toxin [unclassified Kitasatospora]KQV05749.1 twitching motility protein PilT [Kitasatospora sp. Root107]KRB62553.1 twitching motility protein PilT [Kitasatospora sp. Root187]
MGYLLDTNVLSELRRRNPDPAVLSWAAKAAPLFTSALVIGEIRQGVESLRRRDAAQADRLAEWLSTVRHSYADRILPVTAEIAETWGRLTVPDPLPVIDGLLAATAQVHGLTFVTRNVKDVARTGVSVLNPFEPADPVG